MLPTNHKPMSFGFINDSKLVYDLRDVLVVKKVVHMVKISL
jgi:hypothetical protein